MKTWSAYQTKIFDVVSQDACSVVVEALAGSGKTTTIVEAASLIDPAFITTFVAFNKSIALELTGRLPSNIRAKTLNSMGYGAILYRNKNIREPDENKCRNIYRRLMGPRDLETEVLRLVSYAKTIATKSPDFEELINRFDMVIEAKYIDTVLDYAYQVFEKSMQMTDVVDFDDQVWMPAVGMYPLYKSDVIFVDERQDLNHAQVALIRKALRAGGRMIAVGDRRQAIYAFRGADAEAMDNLANEFDAITLPLSICYRCGVKIIELAKQIVPEIEPAPNAIEGEVSNIKETKILDIATDEDMILCRTNAPLVSTALHLIAIGKKAQIRGRKIGDSLVALITRVRRHYHDIEQAPKFYAALREYVDNEVYKLLAAEKTGPANALRDQSDTLIALAPAANTVDGLIERINQIFADDVKGVTLSSIHKAKGTEAKRVMLLRPDLMPHPMAKTPLQREQEMNLKYVAETRAREHLMWVN